MRYPPKRKQETKMRILEGAMKRFRRDGYEATGVKSLMQDVGLTNGAFYAHFESKQHLLSEVIKASHEHTREAVDQAVSGDSEDEGIWSFVDRYLSKEHRDNPGEGCPTATLVQEVARQGPEIRKVYEESIGRILEAIEKGCPKGTRAESREWAIAICAMLVGGIEVSRAVEDKSFSDEILRATRDMARRIAEPL